MGKNRRKMPPDFSGLHICISAYSFLSLGLRLVLLRLKTSDMHAALLFGLLWLACMIVVLCDRRSFRRSGKHALLIIILLLIAPAICAFLLGYTGWGIGGFAEAAVWLYALKHANAQIRKKEQT